MEIESIGFANHGKPWLWGDNEDIEFNQRTNGLFYYNALDGSTDLYREILDFEDLKEALWYGFNYDVNKINIDI